MAYTYKPIFVATPKTWHAHISAANTVRDGSSGTLVDLVAGGTNGSRVDKITIRATATTTAGMVRFFLDDGVNTRAFVEVPVTAITPSASLPAFSAELVRDDGLAWVFVPSGWTLKVATHNAETFDVTAEGGDL